MDISLRLSGVEPRSVFGMFGEKENDATFALGWTLAKSPTLLARLCAELTGSLGTTLPDTLIELQRYNQEGGFTDIEIDCPNVCHIVIEAKRGWSSAEIHQLRRYSKRFDKSGRGKNLLVSISAADQHYAAGQAIGAVDGIPVLHRSWGDINRMIQSSQQATKSPIEKLWLGQLNSHLEGYVRKRDPKDNQVFVVSLSKEPVSNDPVYRWVDVIKLDSVYFHPVGTYWPVIPPNYIGFRYDGRLQSVHYIESFRIVGDLSREDSRWPRTTKDHFIYALGPAMKPNRDIRTGNIFRTGRVWCAIDTLLSGKFNTISDARDETNRRNTAAS